MATDEPAGPESEQPSRSDLKLYEQALREEWPLPPKVRKGILQAAVNLVFAEAEARGDDDDDDAATDDGGANARIRIAAMRVLAQFGNLNVKQQALDLARQKHADRLRREAGAVTDRTEGPDPSAVERALKALNDPSPDAPPEGDAGSVPGGEARDA